MSWQLFSLYSLCASLVPETFLYVSELIEECHDWVCILDYFRCNMEMGRVHQSRSRKNSWYLMEKEWLVICFRYGSTN